jgi:quercetin dioxygenase-like cupin family protein
MEMIILDLKDIAENDVSGYPLFTGGMVKTQAILEEGFQAEKIQIVNVMFQPGARNKFHTHNRAQILYVTEGEGVVASREKEYRVTKGTTIYIPAGEEHWHGAIKDAYFTHLSIIGQPQEMKIVE